jgi:cell division protein FtsW
LAAWLEVKKENLKNITEGLGTFLAIFGVIAMLMISQPDIGTLSIITLTSFIVYFVGGGKLRHILMIFVIGAVIVFALAQWKPYIQNRFRCLIDPGFDKQKVCYQTNQALIAVGSGGIWGRGLGESRQKYMYIPEIHADSIFAIIAEETGLIISTILILAYLLVFYRGYLIARRAPDDFGRILAIGIVSSIAVQTVVNIGGVINIMPMTGVTLPLISSGGSSMIATMASLGVLVNISKQTKNVKTESVIYKRGKDTRK